MPSERVPFGADRPRLVVDASVLVNVVTRAEGSEEDAERIVGEAHDVHAPELVDLEVVHVLRRLMRTRSMSERRAQEAVDFLTDLPIERHPHLPLLTRVWQHRVACTAYDAAYLALAEGLGATLVTADAGLARTASAFVPVQHR